MSLAKRSKGPGFTPVLVALALTLLLGLAVTWEELGRVQETQLLKAIALRKGQSPDVLITVVQWITWAGDAAQRSLVMIGFAAFLCWKKRYRGALVMLVFPAVAGATSSLIKQLFARARPDVVPHLDSFGNLSFPSGHATSAFAIALLAAMLVARTNRPLWVGVAFAIASLIAGSRLLLGVHWPSDVIGGMILGTGFALAGAATAQRWGDRVR